MHNYKLLCQGLVYKYTKPWQKQIFLAVSAIMNNGDLVYTHNIIKISESVFMKTIGNLLA